jgi:membrane associated rhomboid family serine protease
MTYRNYRSTMDFGGYGLTPAVKGLLIANTATFVFFIVANAAGFGDWDDWLMLVPHSVTHRLFLWQLVTYMFLHAGFFHILFNMFALWMFGGELERTWGTARFLQYYFLTGIGSALTVVAVSPNSLVATLGASGAIYGILLAYGVLFADRIIYFYFIIPMKAKYFVMIIGAIEFLSAIATPGSLVSHVAHLGGMIFGFVYLRGRPFYFQLQNRYYRWRRLRLQRSFEVYRREQDRKEERRGPWVH